MKKLLLTLLISSSVLSGSLFAQNTFSKVYYGSSSTSAYSVVEAVDSGFVIAGSNSNAPFILKLDTAGTVIWKKQIGNGAFDSFNSIANTKDSCYILAGKIYNTSEMLLVKVSASGDTLWSKLIPGADEAFSVSQTFDNGFILSGYKSNGAPPYSSMVISKTDSIGNLQWVKTFSPGNNENISYSIKQTPDSGYVMIGTMVNYPPYSQNALLTKLSVSGNVTWSKKFEYGTSDYYQGFDVIVKNDGYLCFISVNGSPSLIKTDLSGNVVRCKIYQGYGNSCSNCVQGKVHNTSDGGYILTDGTGATFGGSAMDIIKTDSLGNLIWSDYPQLYPIDVIETKDHGFFILGNGPVYGVHPLPTGQPQIGVIKTDSLGLTSYCSSPGWVIMGVDTAVTSSITLTPVSGGSSVAIHPTITEPTIVDYVGCVSFLGGIENTPENYLTVFPNPFNVQATISFSGVISGTVSLSDLLGKEVFNSGKLSAQHEFIISRASLKSGMYILQVRTESEIFTKKIIIE
jgi:hypothetical protein